MGKDLSFTTELHWTRSRPKDLSLVVSMNEQALPNSIAQHRHGQGLMQIFVVLYQLQSLMVCPIMWYIIHCQLQTASEFWRQV